MTFIAAADAANLPVEKGLSAVNADDRVCIQFADRTSCTGSVDMDDAYRIAEGQSNRWDYGIGYRVENDEFAVWIEPHSATSDREVATMVKKLKWLKNKLAQEDFEALRKLTEKAAKKGFKRFWWVTDGKIGIRKGTKDTNLLSKQGLNFPCRMVTLGRD